MDEYHAGARLFAVAAPVREYTMPDCAYMHQELKRKGVTLMLLWEEYQQSCEVMPTSMRFCLHYRQYRSRVKFSMRQTHKVGEKLFVDYCGDGIPIIDQGIGEIRHAQIFLVVLGASGYTFAKAAMSQKLPDRIGSHVRMFEFFG